MPENTDNPLDRLIDAMLATVAEAGWQAVTVADAAEAAGLSAGEGYALCPDRVALLGAYVRRVDVGACADAGEPPDDADGRYDMLLDITMRRFEVLQADRAAVERLIEGVARDPQALIAAVFRGYRSFAYLAGAAGYPAEGLRGLVVAKALCAAWLATQRVWLRDETPDLSETMAALDRNLRRFVEPVDGGFAKRRRDPDSDFDSDTAAPAS